MLDIANWIAFGAFLAASLAAVYAKATVRAANKANEIALHSEKLKTYKGILDILLLLQRDGVKISAIDLWNNYDYVELTEFYFNKALSDRVREFYDLCKAIVASRNYQEEARERGETVKEKIWVDQLGECLKAGEAVIEELRDELRIHSPNKG
jgi:hypothetical protein